MLALQSPDWPALTLACGAGAEAKVAFFAGDATRSRAALHRQVALQEAAGAQHFGDLANLVMLERKAGHVERAVTLGLSLVERLRGTRAERSLNYARLNLAGAAIQAQNMTLARSVITDAWPAAARFGLYQSWLYRLYELARAEGRSRAAVCFAQARLALADEGQVPADADDRRILQTELDQAAERWPADECERLRCDGLALTHDTALALALASPRAPDSGR